VRREILAVASTVLRENGIGKLSIGAVLDRAALGTRAFYRHFESKDDLVAALFLDMARVEERRLRRRMAPAATEVDAVAAWIDGRLDLAFDDKVKSDLRRLSMEAQSQSFALVQPAYAEMLRPLTEALQRGLQSGVFHHVDPMTDAQFIHGVVWAGINQHWATGNFDRNVLRERMLQFCLRGLGVRVTEPIKGD
jgi:AcrR family transcriptional regulator